VQFIGLGPRSDFPSLGSEFIHYSLPKKWQSSWREPRLIYYEVEGEGQPLMFIHGLGSSTQDWEFQVPKFSRTYKVITFDLRAHGQSDKPPGPTASRCLPPTPQVC
jgi:pimeloyl-ACP methyl ester carboxylesterase